MIRVLLLILAALPLLAQTTVNTPTQTLPASLWCADGSCMSLVVPSGEYRSIEQRVAALEAKASPCVLPPSGIAFWDPVERRAKILTPAEANALLVALAKAINEASAQRAVEDRGKK